MGGLVPGSADPRSRPAAHGPGERRPDHVLPGRAGRRAAAVGTVEPAHPPPRRAARSRAVPAFRAGRRHGGAAGPRPRPRPTGCSGWRSAWACSSRRGEATSSSPSRSTRPSGTWLRPATARRSRVCASSGPTSTGWATTTERRRRPRGIAELTRPMAARSHRPARHWAAAAGAAAPRQAHRSTRTSSWAPCWSIPGSTGARSTTWRRSPSSLGAFDRMHVVRALVAAAMVERFGPGCRVPLVEHAESLVLAVYRRERVLAEDPEATGRAGRRLAGHARQGPPGSPDRPRTTWRRDPTTPAGRLTTLAALAAGVPDRFRVDPASYGMVVQPHGADLDLQRHLCRARPHGEPVPPRRPAPGRRRHRPAADPHPALYGPGVRLLEDRGLPQPEHQRPPPILDEWLDPTGWRGLRLAHDAATDTVSIVDAAGAPVKVLALGAQLPSSSRTRSGWPPGCVRRAGWCSTSPGTLHRQRRHPSQVRAGPTTTVGYPRLRVGRVVVSRRRWYPGADFPARRRIGRRGRVPAGPDPVAGPPRRTGRGDAEVAVRRSHGVGQPGRRRVPGAVLRPAAPARSRSTSTSPAP